MSDLLKLDNIAKRDGKIKAFTLDTNFISGKIGKFNWGELTIAVDNQTILNHANDEVVGVLYIISKEEWNKEATK